jgi:hypothetical protein
MKFVLFLIFLVGCGNPYLGNKHNTNNTASEQTGTDAVPTVITCTTKQITNGATITCPDGTTSTILNGDQGVQGQAGISGSDGNVGPAGASGQSGSVGPMGPIGPAGVAGPSGVGLPGVNGQNCTVAYSAIGATITCANGSVTVANGINGTDGTSVTTEKLCADSSAGFPEYGFVIGGSVYGVYYGYLDSSGNPSNSTNGTLEAFMSKLTPGQYMSTNGTGCTFTVNSDGSITH